ncbi:MULTISPECIES: acetyl/propionyl/methylcrotonyl-CoA carboxylase subunit alpha [unclassified Dietzia]|uniref:acetyl/propionyl/methylcrotonyl-CoA carboxylase subunit alpha n=4 Tax=Dietzia TaxID=37914 RepID=UPI000D21E442|nr:MULTISPECIES: acetyl/propionyl/methylcrotonyl-CoA carboxylase subunit alpha [unclassified Dietzia]AVZ39973.1 acetyl/propionyl-CoA carboxylase subunit alpha [Dietzia sp. JS16-p6b]QGW25383.1 acyl-CoA carboxylase alpha chain [Dietzia sp. DQ12-45-1b]
MSEELSQKLHTVLVANRGEIACRVIRSLRAAGIRSVAVYSDADADALHVRMADAAVRLGPAQASQSYLDIDKVIDACRRTGAQAVHPGYGFLSENSRFARALEEAGLIFVGPPATAIETMGDKITAKAAVSARDVPTVPGISRPGLTDDELVAGADEVGYPVLVKPSAGGGGKGMRRVERPEDLRAALDSSRRESAGAFGDDTLFLERFVDTPRHIEVQVLADTHGNVIHLGERECSLQRRHQKVIEEAPSALLDEVTRQRIGAAACDAARSVGYVGAGTVEFIVSAHAPDEFFFMEMNTRLQVEHPVTEMVTGVDLVDWQVRIAAGEELTLRQEDITLTGHAIEARVYAEDPAKGFLPTGGTVLGLEEPSGDGIRVDSGLRVGTVVGSDYDPMLGKVIAHGTDRAEALARLDAALADTHVLGLRTNIDFCRFLLSQPEVVAGDLDTGLLDRTLDDYTATPAPEGALVAVAMHRTEERWARVPAARRGPWDVPNGWRVGGRAEVWTRLDSGPGSDAVTVGLRGTPDDAEVTITDATIGSTAEPEVSSRHRARVARDGGSLRLTVDDTQQRWTVVRSADPKAADTFWVAGDGGTWDLRLLPLIDSRIHDAGLSDGQILSPMPGSVIACFVADGDEVTAGQNVLAVEAMKMEHALSAPIDGVVRLNVTTGEQVPADHLLATVEPHPSTPDPSTEESEGEGNA